MNEVRRIDLVVPQSWNQCSTPQLEQIAQILLLEQASVTRYRPFDPLKFKARCFFALAGLEVVGEGLFRRNRNEKPFPIEDWQLMSFVNDNLQWLDDFSQLQIFPYEQYPPHSTLLTPHFSLLTPPSSLLTPRLSCPQPLLDGYTWQRYRQTQDYLQLYVMLTNEQGDAKEIEDARVHFLMAVFDAQKPYRCLRRMPAYRFQLILIWWQSQMAWLQQKFRRCFKKSAEGGSSQLPIELYTRSTATLQKYLSLSEAQINQQPCLVVLQHLEDMAREAEEMERIRRKSK